MPCLSSFHYLSNTSSPLSLHRPTPSGRAAGERLWSHWWASGPQGGHPHPTLPSGRPHHSPPVPSPLPLVSVLAASGLGVEALLREGLGPGGRRDRAGEPVGRGGRGRWVGRTGGEWRGGLEGGLLGSGTGGMRGGAGIRRGRTGSGTGSGTGAGRGRGRGTGTVTAAESGTGRRRRFGSGSAARRGSEAGRGARTGAGISAAAVPAAKKRRAMKGARRRRGADIELRGCGWHREVCYSPCWLREQSVVVELLLSISIVSKGRGLILSSSDDR